MNDDFNTEAVLVSVEEYQYLKDRLAFLECLEQCGVDNWDGYSAAIELHQEPTDDRTCGCDGDIHPECQEDE